MKKSSLFGVIVILALVAVGVFALSGGDSGSKGGNDDKNATSTASVPVSETTKISRTVSEYSNAELGFSVKYPSGWQAEEGNAGVTFVIPVEKTPISTIGTLQSAVQVITGTCAFPPVTTVKDRTTLKVGEKTFNTISMSNTVQGRNYFNRMYSLQKGEICYMFSFASITLAPASKNLTGGEATQATNNNKAIVNSADESFIEMVKSFAYVTGPAGTDETKAAPAPKATATSTATTTPKATATSTIKK